MTTTTDIGRPDAAVPSTPTSSPWPGIMTVVAGAVLFDGALLQAQGTARQPRIPCVLAVSPLTRAITRSQARYADNVIPTAA